MEKEKEHTFPRINEAGELELVDMYTGTVLENSVACRKVSYVYSIEWGDAICNAIRLGMTMKEIEDNPELPPSAVVYHWKKLHPDFAEKLVEAKRMRAEYYRDMVIETAEGTSDKDQAVVNRLKIEAYKWAASKDSPAEFGENIKVDNTHSGQVGFYALRTGVPHADEIELTETPDTDKLEIDNSGN